MAKFSIGAYIEIYLHQQLHTWLDIRDWGDRQTAECQCGKRWSA